MSAIDLDAIRARVDAYDVMADAEEIFDEKRFYRGYAAKAHTLAQDVPDLLDELERLSAELARKNNHLNQALAKLGKVNAVVEAAKAWAAWHSTALVDGGMFISEHTLRAAVDALGGAVKRGEEVCASCGGARWVDDEGWSPENPEEWRGGRSIGKGRIPCGACNHGGWNVPDGEHPRLTAMPGAGEAGREQ